MNLDDFINTPVGDAIKPGEWLPRGWLERLWQAAHSEGEKVGWEKGMRYAAELCRADESLSPHFHGGAAGCKYEILAAIDARKDK